MALESLYIRVTHAGASTGAILLSDIDSGFDPLSTGARQRRPGAVYVGASSYVDLALSSTVLQSYESGAIRQFVDAGELTVSLLGGVTQVLSFLYEVATLGGTTAASPFILTALDGSAKQIPADAILLRSWTDVPVAFVGGGASLSLGHTVDPDGFMGVTGVGSLTLDAIIAGAGALIATKNTTATNVVAAVSGANFTAGTAVLHIEVLASIG